ncbi:MAG TPA: IS630 transposase-related protein [Puia sp.]|jgi:transposase|nr:IS630 transposase-related protein [Puia sp.]
MKAYSQDLRDRVIKAYTEDNMKPSTISKVFKICTDTVYDWLNRFKNTGDYSSKQGVGCGPVFRFTDKEAILEFIEKNPDADGIAIRDAVAPELPMSTFYDTLARMGITYKKRAKIQRAAGG